MGFGFFEDADRGTLFIRLEYPTHYNLENTISRVKEVEEKVKNLPHLKHMVTTVGKVQGVLGMSSEGVYLAQILLVFTQKTERPGMSVFDIREQVEDILKDHLDCLHRVSNPSTMGGESIPIQLEISGDNRNELQSIVTRLGEHARGLNILTDVDTSVRLGRPELRIYPNKPLLADLNFSPLILGMLLRGNLEGITAGTYKEEGRNYDIVVKFEEEEGKNQVENFLLPGMPGKPVNLTTVAEVKEDVAPVAVLRKDKMRTEKLFSGVAHKQPLGTAINELTDVINKYGQLPQGYGYFFAGEPEIMKEAQLEFARAGIIAVVLIILTLAALLESFKQPLFILITLPLGLIGVIWSLYLTGYSLSMFVLLGLVMLSGIVVNNAILIMDELNQIVAAGNVPRHKAMIKAAADQLRPIIMITIAAFAGMVPLAIGTGLGSEMRVDLGISSIGGIVISGVLTLIVIPIVYDMFTRGKLKEKEDININNK